MKKGRLYNKQEIEIISKSAIGKSIEDIMNEEVVTIDNSGVNKGGLGQLVEQYLFGIQNNSESEPDFMPAGIELKVTPYKRIKGGKLSAKERLVLNIINYMDEWKNDFKDSHFWFKNNTIQLLWYLWEPNKNKDEFKITNEVLLNLALSEDLKQIKRDWNTIISKIKDGKAHEISEADTMYLGACTKGATAASSFRKQPFSDILAKQRAFCFKTSYMTQLVRKYIGTYEDIEKIIKNDDDTFDSFISKIVDKYKGKKQKDLMRELNINSNAKSLNSMIVSRMFGVKGNLNETEEFLKANIIPRTVRIEETGNIKESMPFPSFKFTDIVKQSWEESDLKQTLETTKYLFFVFKKEKDDYIFKGIKLWNMPEILLENEVKEMWIKTKSVIENGNIVKEVDDKGNRFTNFPGMKENRVCHVRPHARDKFDTYPLPVSDKLTGENEYMKHCFWINDKYLEEILKEFND